MSAAREREDAGQVRGGGDQGFAADRRQHPPGDRVHPREQGDQDDLVQTLLANVAATEKAMLDALARHCIQRIEPAAGERFDPHRHHAMMEIEDRGAPPGTVQQVLQPSYAYHDRLLRPALVGVATGGGSASQERGPAAAAPNDCDSQPEGGADRRI